MTQNKTTRSASSSPSRGERKVKAERHEDHFEFGGPFGAVFIPVLLFVTVYFLYFGGNGDCVVTIGNILNGSGLKCVADQAKKYTLFDFVVPTKVSFILCRNDDHETDLQNVLYLLREIGGIWLGRDLVFVSGIFGTSLTW